MLKTTSPSSSKAIKTTKLSTDSIELIPTSLVNWYLSNRRMLPWRGDGIENSSYKTPTKSAYGTWVSEIMLQQTKVETVIPYWFKWMERFPTVDILAQATEEDVNQYWAGLGYYRRARFLLQGAKTVVNDYNSIIPNTSNELIKIPGIGRYTAGAISSIAFDQPSSLVDGNVIRVFSRLFAIDTPMGNILENECWNIADSLMHKADPSSFNQGLMELGATVCTPRNPKCNACPLSSVCTAYSNEQAIIKRKQNIELKSNTNNDKDREEMELEIGDIESLLTTQAVVSYPRKVPKKKPRQVVLSVAVLETIIGEEKKFLFVKRPNQGLLANQWEFPSIIVWEEENVKAFNKNKKGKSNNGKILEKPKDEELADLIILEDNNDQDIGVVGPPSMDDGELWKKFPSFIEETLNCKWMEGECKKEKNPPEIDIIMKEEGKEDEVDSLLYTSRALIPIKRETEVKEITHIFSHQKHTMHVTFMQVNFIPSVSASTTATATTATTATSTGHEWLSGCGNLRQVKWMSSQEIVDAGITSGMKKILTAVTKGYDRDIPLSQKHSTVTTTTKAQAKGNNTSKTKSKSQKGKEDSAQQPSIASFFKAAPRKRKQE